VEFPFAARRPGKDYYILMDEGTILGCECENEPIDNCAQWQFRTSMVRTAGYAIPSQTALAEFNPNAPTAPRLNYAAYEPRGSNYCGSATPLIISFNEAVVKGTGSVLVKNRSTGLLAASLSIGSATVTGSQVNFGDIPGLDSNTMYDITVPAGIVSTNRQATTVSSCGATRQFPAAANVVNTELNYGFQTAVELEMTPEFCTAPSGLVTPTSNIRLNFNKPITVNETSPAWVEIYDQSGALFQRIDLRGSFVDDNYCGVYTTGGSSININPTAAFDGGQGYYINIDSGVINDAACDIAWPGVTDTTTVAWRTDGIESSEPSGPTFSSVFLDFRINRPVKAGRGVITVLNSSGRLLTQIRATDPEVTLSSTPIV
jgi:hypothetical protein